MAMQEQDRRVREEMAQIMSQSKTQVEEIFTQQLNLQEQEAAQRMQLVEKQVESTMQRASHHHQAEMTVMPTRPTEREAALQAVLSRQTQAVEAGEVTLWRYRTWLQIFRTNYMNSRRETYRRKM